MVMAALVAPVAGRARRAARAEAAQVAFTGVERVFAFADVHGAYDDLVKLLKAVGVVDGDLHWSGGRTHLVSTGDLLDRGKDSRKVLDLLMRLQGEAATAGGQLHVTLGNHEAMNLLGHVRDVAPGELEAYAAEEPAGVREKERTEWIARNGADSGAKFDQRFPVGYFGHRVTFAPDGVYGRWLLALPVAIMIDDTLFMHGGPSAVLAGLSLPEINLRYRTALTDYLSSVAPLEAAGLVLPEDDFGQRASRAEERGLPPASTPTLPQDTRNRGGAPVRRRRPQPDDRSRRPQLVSRCRHVQCLRRGGRAAADPRRAWRPSPGDRSYRNPRRARGLALRRHGDQARYGHESRGVSRTRFGARTREGCGASRICGRAAVPGRDPGGELYLTSATMTEADVAALLERGEVTTAAPRAPGVMDVVVAEGARKANAVFIATTDAAADKELAAMKLDRALGLGLVPATVEREVQGQRGVLQARPAKWTTEAEVQAPRPARCRLVRAASAVRADVCLRRADR